MAAMFQVIVFLAACIAVRGSSLDEKTRQDVMNKIVQVSYDLIDYELYYLSEEQKEEVKDLISQFPTCGPSESMKIAICEKYGFTYLPESGSCFKMFVDRTRNWDEAKQHCQSFGEKGRLAFLNTKEIQQAVEKKIINQLSINGKAFRSSFYIGMERTSCNERMKWVDRSQSLEVTFSTWASKQPDCYDQKARGRENVVDVFYRDGRWQWNDVTRDYACYQLCEITF